MAGLKQIHCKLGKSNLLAGLKQIQIRISVLNFVMGQISAAQYQAECCLPSSNGPQATTKTLSRIWLNETFRPQLDSPWGCHPSKPLEVDKLRRGLSFSGCPFQFQFPKALNAKCMLHHVSKDKKTWLVQTQVRKDFHWFQLTVHIRHYQSFRIDAR